MKKLLINKGYCLVDKCSPEQQIYNLQIELDKRNEILQQILGESMKKEVSLEDLQNLIDESLDSIVSWDEINRYIIT